MRKNTPQHQNSTANNSINTTSYSSLNQKLQQQNQTQQSTHRLSQEPSVSKPPSETIKKLITQSLHSPHGNHDIDCISLNSRQQNQQNTQPLVSLSPGSQVNQASSKVSSGMTSQSKGAILKQQSPSTPVNCLIPEQRLSSYSFSPRESKLLTQASGGNNGGGSTTATSSSSYLNQYKVQHNTKQSQKPKHQPSNGSTLSKKSSQTSIFQQNKTPQSFVQQGESTQQTFQLSSQHKSQTQPQQQQSLYLHSFQKKQQQQSQQSYHAQSNSSERINSNAIIAFKHQTDLAQKDDNHDCNTVASHRQSIHNSSIDQFNKDLELSLQNEQQQSQENKRSESQQKESLLIEKPCQQSSQTILDKEPLQKQQTQRHKVIPTTDSLFCKNQKAQSQKIMSFSQHQEISTIQAQSEKKTLNKVSQSSYHHPQHLKSYPSTHQRSTVLASQKSQLLNNNLKEDPTNSGISLIEESNIGEILVKSFNNTNQSNDNLNKVAQQLSKIALNFSKPQKETKSEPKRGNQSDVPKESYQNISKSSFSENQGQFQRNVIEISLNDSAQLLSQDQQDSFQLSSQQEGEIANFKLNDQSNSIPAPQRKYEWESLEKSISSQQLYQINDDHHKLTQNQIQRTTLFDPNKDPKASKIAQVIGTIQRKGASNNTLQKKTRKELNESRQHVKSMYFDQQNNNSEIHNSRMESTERSSKHDSQSCSKVSGDLQSNLLSLQSLARKTIQSKQIVSNDIQISNRNKNNSKHEQKSQQKLSSSILIPQQLVSSRRTEQLVDQSNKIDLNLGATSLLRSSKTEMQKNSNLPFNQPPKSGLIQPLEGEVQLKQEQNQRTYIQQDRQQGTTTTTQSLVRVEAINHKKSSQKLDQSQQYLEQLKLTLNTTDDQSLNLDNKQKQFTKVSANNVKDSKPQSAMTTSARGKNTTSSTSIATESARDSHQGSNTKKISNTLLSSKQAFSMDLHQYPGEKRFLESNTVRNSNKTTQYSTIPSSKLLNRVENENENEQEDTQVNITINSMSSIKPTVPSTSVQRPSLRDSKEGGAQKSDRNVLTDNFSGLKMKSPSFASDSKNRTSNYQKTEESLMREKQKQIQSCLDSKRDESFNLIRQFQSLQQQAPAEATLVDVNQKNSHLFDLHEVLSNDDSQQQMQKESKSSSFTSELPHNQAKTISIIQDFQNKEKTRNIKKEQALDLKINTSNSKEPDKGYTIVGGMNESTQKNISSLIKPSKIISYLQQQQKLPQQFQQQFQQKTQDLKSNKKVQQDVSLGQRSRNEWQSQSIQQQLQNQLNKRSEMNTKGISAKVTKLMIQQVHPELSSSLLFDHDENSKKQSNIFKNQIGQKDVSKRRQQYEDETIIQGSINSIKDKDQDKRQVGKLGYSIEKQDSYGKDVIQITATRDSQKTDKLLKFLELTTQTQQKQTQLLNATSRDQQIQQIQKHSDFAVNNNPFIFIQQQQTIQQRQQIDRSYYSSTDEINVQLIQTISSDHRHRIQALASNINNLLFTGSQDYDLRIYDQHSDEETLELRQTIRHRKAVSCLSLMPARNNKTQLLLSGCADGIVRVFSEEQSDISMENQRFSNFQESQFIKSHNAGISALLGIDGIRGISGSQDGDVCLWDLQKAQTQNYCQESVISKFCFKQGITSIHQLPQEQGFLVLTADCVYLVDPRISGKVQEITQNNNYQLNFTALQTFPNRNQFILSSHSAINGSACLEFQDLRYQSISPSIISKLASPAKSIEIINQHAVFITQSKLCSVRIDNFNQNTRILADNIQEQISLEINRQNSRIYTGSKDHVLRAFKFNNY